MNKPELPPGYAISEALQAEEQPFEFSKDGEEPIGCAATYADALREVWAHWRVEGDPAWVEYLDSLPGPDDLQREPFESFADVSPEQLADAATHAADFSQHFETAGMGKLTATHAILAVHLHAFGQEVLKENGKCSMVTRKIFDDSSAAGQAGLLMLAALMQRLYSAPYDGINVASVDFINVLTAVVDIAATTAKPKIRHGGVAKGKRPT